MALPDSVSAPGRKPLRLWPAVVIVIVQWILRFVCVAIWPDTLYIGAMAAVFGTVLVILWWLLLSRAPWRDRLIGLLFIAVGVFITRFLVDVSISTGAQGFLLFFLLGPVLSMAFVGWALLAGKLPPAKRRATMAAAIGVACGMFTLIKTGGFTSDFHQDLHWRWAKTAEDRLVEQTRNQRLAPVPPAVAPAAAPVVPAAPVVSEAPKPSVQAPDTKKANQKAAAAQISDSGAGPVWPGFRGPHRDDQISGVKIKTDWNASPPVALWKHPVGPGWSSFAVRNGLIYTQEQRGPDEVVACYRLASGDPVWIHRDAARFWESNGGPGPRGTPTLADDRAYTFGATGIVNVLDARTGSVIWSHNAAADTGAKTPQWGFASSPLVTGDLVIVATSGDLIAYDKATGAKRWTGPAHGVSYSSPQLFTIGGVPQVLLLSEAGATSVALADGALLWDYGWQGYPIVQPAQTAEGDLLFAVTNDSGIRRLAVTQNAGSWKTEERWTSKGLKPYFNDFVVHDDHAYGFDGSILSCIDLKDGKRVWKGGRYGSGQLVLLSDEGVLLVVSEEGDIALVKAAPDQFTELAHAPAIEGKTWNHPVLAGDTLLVRNGQEMAAFRLALADR